MYEAAALFEAVFLQESSERLRGGEQQAVGCAAKGEPLRERARNSSWS